MKKKLMIIIGSIIAFTFVTLYFFDPFEGVIEMNIFDALILFSLLLINSFFSKWRIYSTIGIYGYMIFIIIRYFL